MIPESLIMPLRALAALLGIFLFVSIAQTSMQMIQTSRTMGDVAPVRTVTLTGTGTVDVVPSKASITISVMEEGEDKAAVQNAANTTMMAVQKAVKGEGVPEADIQTNAYQLYPQYDYTSGVQKTTGYQMTQSIEVTVTDIDKVSGVIDAATTAGANSVSTPYFTVENEEQYKDEARKEAAEAIATQKASYESTLGVHLGRIVDVSESNGGAYPYPVYALGVAEKDASVSSSAPIESGTNTVEVTLSITYALK